MSVRIRTAAYDATHDLQKHRQERCFFPKMLSNTDANVEPQLDSVPSGLTFLNQLVMAAFVSGDATVSARENNIHRPPMNPAHDIRVSSTKTAPRDEWLDGIRYWDYLKFFPVRKSSDAPTSSRQLVFPMLDFLSCRRDACAQEWLPGQDSNLQPFG